MTDDQADGGSRVFLIAFVATAPLAAWLIVAFSLHVVIEGWIPDALRVPSVVVHAALLACLYVATWLGIRSVRRNHPRFLRTPARYSLYDALPPMAVWWIASYVALGVTLGLVSYALVDRADEHWFFVVYAFALWIPAWFATPIAALIAWRRESF